MPQLDKFAFVPQILWFVFVFFALYFVLVEYSLPNLFKILFFRKNKLITLQSSSTKFSIESYFFKQNTDILVQSFLTKVKHILEQVSKASEGELFCSFSGVAHTQDKALFFANSFLNHSLIKDNLNFSILKTR